METDIMRMQREAEQRVRELREQERRAAHTGEPRGRTAEGLAENRTEWMHASGFQPLSEYKARHMPRQQAAERPKPEPIQDIAKCPPEKRGDGGLLSAFGSDPEQLFLLLLAFLLVKNGARVELIIALLYLAM